MCCLSAGIMKGCYEYDFYSVRWTVYGPYTY